MNTKNLSTLKIHKLTKAQYEREFAEGNIEEDALYLTPNEEAPSLPDISASDNGKILMVVDGVWTAVTIPSAEEASF